MRITAITSEEFRWPRHKPIRDGKHTYTRAGLGVVKIETDENVTGIEMEANVQLGARAIKMKVGGVRMRKDVERVEAVREAIDPGVKLLVDANCAYRAYEAIQFAERIEAYDSFWFEEPVAPDDSEGMRKLVEKTCVPIATGEKRLHLPFSERIRTTPRSNHSASYMIGLPCQPERSN